MGHEHMAPIRELIDVTDIYSSANQIISEASPLWAPDSHKSATFGEWDAVNKRFVFKSPGKVILAGIFFWGTDGPSVLNIRRNGTELLLRLPSPGEHRISLILDVAAGNYIDFIVVNTGTWDPSDYIRGGADRITTGQTYMQLMYFGR